LRVPGAGMRHFTTFRLKSFHFTLNCVIEQVTKKEGIKNKEKKTLLLRRSGEKERLVEIVV
jgi:hypothetical protein